MAATLAAPLAAPLFAQQPCENLAKLKLPDLTVTAASPVAAGMLLPPGSRVTMMVPAFCRVSGTIKPEINFEIWLPANWNRKFLMVGNGGLAGTISYSAMGSPLLSGYATASTDTGHVSDNDAHWAQGHMERVIDYAHRGVHVTAQTSKAIIQNFYGAAPAHSYFNGCSNGGEEAMAEAQRYPTDFDGIIAGDPANYYTHLQMGAHLWITQALQTNPDAYIPSAKTKIIGEAVLAACDALDGIKDGILNDPRRCKFDPSALLCKNGDAPDCLTAAQVDTAKKIYQGTRTESNGQIFPGIMPGSEAGQGGWGTWITGNTPGGGSHTTLGMPFMRNIAFEDPNWDFRTFRWERTQGIDSDVDYIDAKLGPIFNNMNPDLKAFQARGGKLIQYHGWADPDISPLNSVNYFESVQKTMGDSKSFYRLFMVPGMYHCNGGPGPNTFDTVAALEQWAEQGKAPEQFVASHSTNNAVDRTRPLCPYPQEAQYKGSGSTDKAENFSCALPK
ncbi:MAG TPA: tannase/feruloyl esterase family alpha/beta hydrolase [Bryobacteraceae bacterium]